MQNKNITGLAHIGIYISDLDRSVTFYEDKLGFECYHKVDIKDDSGITRIAFVRNGSCVIEIVQHPEPRHGKDGVVEHISMAVEDIEAVMADLKAKGIVFETEAPIFLPTMFNGVKFAFFRGPDGEHLEINQLL